MPNLDLSGAVPNDDRLLPRQLLDLAGLLEGESYCDTPSWRKLSPLAAGALLVYEGVCPNRTQACYAGHCSRGIIEVPIDGLIENHRIAVVPNGIDWQDSGTPARVAQQLLMPHSSFKHVKSPKRLLSLIEAIPLVVGHRQDVEFVFAGLGHMQKIKGGLTNS